MTSPVDLFDEKENRILEAGRYGDFKKALEDSGCKKCVLCQSRTRLVVDRGNPEACVVLIGEAPGESEDLKGRAFVGRSGKLLDELMRQAGFDTDSDSLIMNVVKCRPPDNRAPRQEEADACGPYFRKQLSLLKPKLIILLGATALKHLPGMKKHPPMRQMIGEFFSHADYPQARFIVFYHPAYLLRDPRKKADMVEPIRRFMIEWIRVRPERS
ncbi:MAG: uracil-DNA glycosylase [Candidatus Omnitrophota bacterium]